jgi:predicted homoserine dehydrogenase-like protein
MIIVDTALQDREREGRPIRVGMIGAGFMAQGLANHVINTVTGMRMSAVYNRTMARALHVYRYAGCVEPEIATTQVELDSAVSRGVPVVARDPLLVCRSPLIDVVVEVTGSVEFGAHIALEAFRNGKHVVLMNAELDATIGPILQTYANSAGVILSACDGDEPAVQLNLFRWVTSLGLTPRVLGNVKGLQDPYRTPLTQQSWAERWGQSASMVTSFADGSKVSFEQAIVANATGFRVVTRGMSRGRVYAGNIADIGDQYSLDELRARGGIVDYTVGPSGTKVFCLAEHEDDKQRHYLELYKMGRGPLYAFFTPYHLVHLEAPHSFARVVIFGDNVAPPLGGPVVEVCAVAKRDLLPGEVLDDYGCFMTYGEAVNSDEMSEGRYLPEGLVAGCELRTAVAKDAVLTYSDVRLPKGRLADRLRAEQYVRFRGEEWLTELLEVGAGQLALPQR